MNDQSILLVDDEPDLVWAVQRSLSFAGYEVLSAKDGYEALSIARRHFPDLIILDINMPRMDGLEVCRTLREDPQLESTPVIFLTNRNETSDRINGLEEGGDDYLGKPFDLHELKARVQAILRRAKKNYKGNQTLTKTQDIIMIGEIKLDPHSRQVYLDDKFIQLTATEYDLFYYLITHPGKVFNSQQLLQQVWNYPPDSGETSLVRWHMKNLRTKLEKNPANPSYLRTIPRQGYMLEQRQNNC
jgi:DNA-binding response OmpR family regulator